MSGLDCMRPGRLCQRPSGGRNQQGQHEGRRARVERRWEEWSRPRITASPNMTMAQEMLARAAEDTRLVARAVVAAPPRLAGQDIARGSGQVGSTGNVSMPLPTRSDAHDVLKFCVSRLYPVLGCPHLPALREIFSVRLSAVKAPNVPLQSRSRSWISTTTRQWSDKRSAAAGMAPVMLAHEARAR
jgi:hypothetical protein